MTQQDSCINWTKWARDMAQGRDLVRKRAQRSLTAVTPGDSVFGTLLARS